MIKNVVVFPFGSRRRVIIGACLLAALTAVPAFAVLNLTIKLNPNASFNGYKVEHSANETEVRCVGVHAGTSKSSPILNGSYEVRIVLTNKRQLTKRLTFTDGTAEFGVIGPVDSATKVSTVSVIAPMY